MNHLFQMDVRYSSVTARQPRLKIRIVLVGLIVLDVSY